MPHSPSMHDLRHVSGLFDMRADFVDAQPYGSGHINDTYCAWYDQAGLRIRFIHQRINHNIFKDPAALMENIGRVTAHSLARLLDQSHPEAHRRTLTVVPSIEGKPYVIDRDGNFWRTYPFIERARGYDEIKTNLQAEQAARAFGEFQKLAADLGGKRLHETIPNFHHTPTRLQALQDAIDADIAGRARTCKAEIDFALARASDCRRVTDLITAGVIPERVTHNDTKLNNVLLDDVTSEGVCVIDLDTTMPGSVLYDFGDMVRTATPTTREDEVDLSLVGIRLDRFDALLRGYLDSASCFLNRAEADLLAFSGKLLTLECGIRFLTDHLEGDVYFKTKRPGHNIDRCRAQFAMVKAIEENLERMEEMVQAVAGSARIVVAA